MDQLIAATRQRVRMLRAIRWGSWGVLGTLVLSLAYVLASRLGWINVSLDQFLLAFNVAGLVVGAFAGAAWPLHTKHVLLEMDRKLNTGEVLLTLHHLLHNDKDNDFTPILSRQFQNLAPTPEAVFRLNRNDLNKSGGIGVALVLMVVFVWAGPIWLPSLGAFTGATGASESSIATASPGEREIPQEFQEQLEELQSRLEELGIEQEITQRDFSQSQQGQDPQDQFIELFEDLQQAQDQALGLQGEGQGMSPSQLQQQRQDQREALENLQDQLQQMVSDFADGNPSSTQQEMSDALRDQLESLPEDDPLRQQLEDALEQRDSQAQQQALEDGQQQLEDRLNAERNLDELRDSLEEWANNQQQPGEDGQQSAKNQEFGQNQQDSNQGEQQDGNQESELGENSQGSPTSGQEGVENAQEGQTQNRPGEGNEAGAGSGQDGQTTAPPQWNPEYKNATIPPGMVPADSVEEWLSRGVPVETSDVPGAAAQFRLSFDQVEALLDLRELSPEMRDIVRLYFLQIIGELNQGASSNAEATEGSQ